MENKDGRLRGASQADWFVMKVIEAQAVAIIKTKPPGVSGREYVEALARRLKSWDEGWKSKAEELQQEVLRLRQELLITRMTPDTTSSTEAAGQDVMMDPSEDLFGPESVGLNTDLQLGSDSETPELFPLDPQPTIISPQPPPPPPPPSSHHGSPGGKAIHAHVQFLQSLCSLHRVKGNNRGLESLWFRPDGDAGSVLVDCVCQLLDSVVAVCRDPPLLGPPDLVLQACQVAAQAMDLFCSQRLPSVEFMRRVEGSLRELTGMLLHWHQFSKLQAAEKLTEYLIALGSSSMSKSFLVRHILSQNSALADELWQAFQDSSGLDKFPVDQYQNSCHLFWILETLLEKSKVPCRVEVGSEETGFLSHLEHRVFLLSEEFPLFSMYMWRIGGLLTSSDRKDPPGARDEQTNTFYQHL